MLEKFRPSVPELAELGHQSRQMRRSDIERCQALVEANKILDIVVDRTNLEFEQTVKQLESAAEWDPGTRRFIKPMEPTHEPTQEVPLEGGERGIYDGWGDFCD